MNRLLALARLARPLLSRAGLDAARLAALLTFDRALAGLAGFGLALALVPRGWTLLDSALRLGALGLAAALAWRWIDAEAKREVGGET